MKEETQLLVDLIKQNKTLNEISEITGLSNKQIFIRLSMLRNSGYLIDKSYYYNGEIRYSLHNPFKANDSNISVVTSKEVDKIRIVLTSDTHLGHKKDELECINSMTEYCINNNIHLVFNSGDFFEGIYENRRNEVKFTTSQEQIDYGLKNYPYDKNILNFVLLGNHDSTFWINNGIDIKTILSERRHDIVPLGYGYGEINVGGCQFRMQHPLRSDYQAVIPNEIKDRIILKGHSHKFKISPGINNMSICIPTLSSVPTASEKTVIPSMVDMCLDIRNNKVCNEYFQQFIFINNKPVRINEINYYIPLCINNPIYEEDIQPMQSEPEENLNSSIQSAIIEAIKETNLYQTNQYHGMSQIEKFNARYQKTKEKKPILH